jgi:hypothetical protein
MKSTNRSRRSASQQTAKKAESREAAPAVREGKHAKGYFLGLGTVAGTIFGVPFGFATANPGMVWAGLVIGVSLGTVYEQKYNHGLNALMR